MIVFLDLLLIGNEALVNVGDDSAAGDSRGDERVQLLVAPHRELKVPGRDSLDLEFLGRVACELQNLGREVLQNRGCVHSCGHADSVFRTDVAPQ